jgi:hypothetical protein
MLQNFHLSLLRGAIWWRKDLEGGREEREGRERRKTNKILTSLVVIVKVAKVGSYMG